MKEGSGAITWSSGATGFTFYRESLQKRAKIIHPDVITGVRGEASERGRFGPYFYGGWVIMPVNPGDCATLFPWILGADASGTTFDLAETLQTFGVLVDKVTDTHEFYNGVVNRAVIHGKQNGPGGPPNHLTVAIQMIFRSYATGTSYPSLTLPVTAQYAPLVFEDSDNSGTSRLVLGAAARQYKEFTLDLNNYVEPRWINALEPATLCPARRTTTLTTTHPYDSGTSNLYNAAVAGAAGSLAFVNGSVSITFTFGNLQADIVTPVITGKREIDLQLQMSARSLSSTPALSCAIDSSP